jgi:hypothetical protein
MEIGDMQNNEKGTPESPHFKLAKVNPVVECSNAVKRCQVCIVIAVIVAVKAYIPLCSGRKDFWQLEKRRMR